MLTLLDRYIHDSSRMATQPVTSCDIDERSHARTEIPPVSSAPLPIMRGTCGAIECR